MKTIKFRVNDSLWEAFFRLFPGQGERSGILRKVVREIVLEQAERIPLETVVAKQICEDLEWEGREEKDG